MIKKSKLNPSHKFTSSPTLMFIRKAAISFLLLITIGMLIPQKFTNPVKGSTRSDYNHHSFWYYPWGKSGTHKGVDIFAKEGVPVLSSVDGIVLFAGKIEMGGNVVLVLGPKWRLHYFAHLRNIETSSLSYVSNGEVIGAVGTTGNAAGKQPHLHYSIMTLVPYVWKMDTGRQGWKKMFYINPNPFLELSNR